MKADPSEQPCGEQTSSSTEEKFGKFCFELALALRRITGRKINHGIEQLPKVIREAIEYANESSPDHCSAQSNEESVTASEGNR
ncbi:MAG: hypothetical protein GYA48_17585 [Chloroflexi bacterium]|nr:hypothetical protein [Chloroflexota bacterium]